MSGGVNSRLLADRAMAVADSSQVRISLFVEVDTTGVFPEASSVSAHLPFWGNLYAQNRLFHAILGATTYLPCLAAM